MATERQKESEPIIYVSLSNTKNTNIFNTKTQTISNQRYFISFSFFLILFSFIDIDMDHLTIENKTKIEKIE